MSDEPTAGEESRDSQGGPSSGGFLSTTKGIITGITSLIVAVTGLTVACEKLLPSEDPPAKVESAASTAAVGKDDAATDQQAGEEEGDPSFYKGPNGLEVAWTGKEWALTSPDGNFTYDDMTVTENNWVLAFDPDQGESGEYLRWPKEGGTMEYSRDKKQSWVTYGEVTPAAE
jgi:hypothetical protein